METQLKKLKKKLKEKIRRKQKFDNKEKANKRPKVQRPKKPNWIKTTPNDVNETHEWK